MSSIMFFGSKVLTKVFYSLGLLVTVYFRKQILSIPTEKIFIILFKFYWKLDIFVGNGVLNGGKEI